MADELLERIRGIGLVPVIKIDKPEHAVPLARALVEGDIPVAEVTFRTDAALKSIEAIAKAVPEIILGAGTVLSSVQAGEAHKAGARFIVSPGFNPKVVDYCARNGVFVLPGINSPTQIEQALEMGISTVKFFPAEASGGVEMLKAMSAPYGKVNFVPTGGIGPDNLRTYLDFSRVVACGGSWMVPSDAIARGDFSTVTRVAKQAVAATLRFRIAGVRVFAEEEVVSRAASLSDVLFGFGSSESMKFSFEPSESDSGARGALTIHTVDVERAIDYLGRKGISVAGANNAPKGPEPIALNTAINGFRVELTRG